MFTPRGSTGGLSSRKVLLPGATSRRGRGSTSRSVGGSSGCPAGPARPAALLVILRRRRPALAGGHNLQIAFDHLPPVMEVPTDDAVIFAQAGVPLLGERDDDPGLVFR